MTFKRSLLTAVCALAFPLAANAQVDTWHDNDEWYMGLGGGYNNVMDTDASGVAGDPDVQFDGGWAAAVTTGWRHHSGLRLELEGAYRENDLDSIGNGPASGADGQITAWSVMGNVLYDFKNRTAWTPYIGAGVGYAHLNLDQASVGGVTVADDDDDTWAVQGIAGISYRAHQNVELFADYRYFTAINPSFRTTAAVGGGTTDVDYDNNTVLVGVRYLFGANKPGPVPVPPASEPAPVAAEPVQAQPNNYMVFFDFDRSNITPEAKETISRAVADAKAGHVVRLEVTGHTDRSGTDAYNMRLSQRRAAAVKRELVAQGIAAKEVATFAKGESSPLVPTGDGVKEPQNRRAEIVLDR